MSEKAFEDWWRLLKPAECDEVEEHFIECWQAATLAERERCANERRSAVAHPGLVNIRPAPHATAAMVPTPSVMLTIGGRSPTPDVPALPEDRK